MRIKPINKFIRFFFGNIAGISLCPFGIYLDDSYNDKYTINHEKVHWVQQKEMLIIPFYIWYGVEYLIRKIYDKNAYSSLSFEKEAYQNQYDLDYLNKRKSYSWIKYLGNKK